MCTVAVERTKLYEQVWTIPGAQLAALYGISDVGLAKKCKRFNIPRPPRGYWARLAAGKRVHKPNLPRGSKDNEVIYLKGWNMPDQTIQQLVDDRASGVEIQDSSSSQAIHPLAVTTKANLLSATPNVEGLIIVATPGFHVRVSPLTIDRSISVLDALMKLWEGRGGEIIIGGPDGELAPTSFAVGPDRFGVLLAENLDESKPVTDPMRITGKLALHIAGDEKQQFRRRWSETKSQRLEKLLKPFVDTLMNAIVAKRHGRLDIECIARQQYRLEAMRKASSQVESREFYWRQELTQEVGQWHESQRVRSYLRELKAAIERGDWTPANAEQFQEWMDWAESYADAMDPISRKPLLGFASQASQVNTPVADLDLTFVTREVLTKLGTPDADSLWRCSVNDVREACEGRYGPVWNEISRVLEALGYDVSKRERVADWL